VVLVVIAVQVKLVELTEAVAAVPDIQQIQALARVQAELFVSFGQEIHVHSPQLT
jgi:hypothetical protein